LRLSFFFSGVVAHPTTYEQNRDSFHANEKE